MDPREGTAACRSEARSIRASGAVRSRVVDAGSRSLGETAGALVSPGKARSSDPESYRPTNLPVSLTPVTGPATVRDIMIPRESFMPGSATLLDLAVRLDSSLSPVVVTVDGACAGLVGA